MAQKIDNSDQVLAAVLGILIILSTVGGFTIMFFAVQFFKYLFS